MDWYQDGLRGIRRRELTLLAVAVLALLIMLLLLPYRPKWIVVPGVFLFVMCQPLLYVLMFKRIALARKAHAAGIRPTARAKRRAFISTAIFGGLSLAAAAYGVSLRDGPLVTYGLVGFICFVFLLVRAWRRDDGGI